MANHRTASWRAAPLTEAALTLCRLWAVLALTVMDISHSAAQSTSTRRNPEPALRIDSVLVFAGAFTTGNLGESLNPFYPHDGNYLVGIAYARDFANLTWGFNLGGEIGYAARFGNDRGSSEVWIGPTLRHRGFPIGNLLTLSPGLVLGLSAVTAPIGIETDRENKHNGSANILFRFSPELAFRFTAWPNFELVYRVHHRSGLYGALGDLKEGSNAHVIGLRWFR